MRGLKNFAFFKKVQQNIRETSLALLSVGTHPIHDSEFSDYSLVLPDSSVA